MRKTMTLLVIFLLLAAILTMAGCKSKTPEAGPIDITAKFTDEQFKKAIYEKIDKIAGSPIYDTDVSDITMFNINDAGVKDLSGIEYFTSLREFDCGNNRLTTLDLSYNTALTRLICGGNQLTALDLSKNTALTYLICFSNQLTALDLSKNIELQTLECDNNQLSSLDLSKNVKLEYFSCRDNNLTALNVRRLPKLSALDCQMNQLTSLNVSGCSALTEIKCWSNQFSDNASIIGLNETETAVYFDPLI